MVKVLNADVSVKFFTKREGYGFFTTPEGDDVIVTARQLKEVRLSTNLMDKKGAPAMIDYEKVVDGDMTRRQVTAIHMIAGDSAKAAGTKNKKTNVHGKRPRLKSYELGQEITGVVRRFNPDGDWGFMKVEGFPDIFFHLSEFDEWVDEDEIVKGVQLSATVGRNEDGRLKAVLIKFAEGENVITLDERRRA